MKRYVIEREVPSFGANDDAGFCNAAKTSNAALSKLAPRVQWEHSYVIGNGTFCVYLADDEPDIVQLWLNEKGGAKAPPFLLFRR
jgi:hypothetical protein